MATSSFNTINYVNSEDSKNFDKLFDNNRPKYKFAPTDPITPEELKSIQDKAKKLFLNDN